MRILKFLQIILIAGSPYIICLLQVSFFKWSLPLWVYSIKLAVVFSRHACPLPKMSGNWGPIITCVTTCACFKEGFHVCSHLLVVFQLLQCVVLGINLSTASEERAESLLCAVARANDFCKVFHLPFSAESHSDHNAPVCHRVSTIWGGFGGLSTYSLMNISLWEK